MSDAESRLMRAMASVRAPAADPAFVLSVLERAEQERFHLAAARAVLRGAGFAAVFAAPLALLLMWAPPQAALEALLATTALTVFVNTVRKAVAAA